MDLKNYLKRSLHSTRKTFLISVYLLTCISFLNLSMHTTTALAAPAPGGNIQNSVVRAVDLAKPAVVRILTTLEGRLTVQFDDLHSATFPQNEGHYPLELSGSGTFISSHGDILTADHVIHPPHDKSMDDVLKMQAAQDVADYINQNFHPQAPYTKEDAYTNMSYGIIRSEATYNKPTSEVYLSKDYVGLINANSLDTVPDTMHARVDRVESESAVDAKDVAIIHVNMTDTPSVRLGDSANVAQQDELTIIGFPGNGDVGDPTKPDPDGFLTSSVNKIYVSSIKTEVGGGPVIQVGGNVEHGDSGGPALDSTGTIVGVVSFYNQSAQIPIGTSFLQASSSARQLLNNLTIDTKPGKFQRAWEQAFANYTATNANHWHQAAQNFKQLQQDYPAFQAVSPFLDYASMQAQHEKLPQRQTNAQPPLLIVELAFILIVILLAVLPWFILRRRHKKQAAYQQAPTESQADALYVPMVSMVPMTPMPHVGQTNDAEHGIAIQPEATVLSTSVNLPVGPSYDESDQPADNTRLVAERMLDAKEQQVPSTPTLESSWQPHHYQMVPHQQATSTELIPAHEEPTSPVVDHRADNATQSPTQDASKAQETQETQTIDQREQTQKLPRIRPTVNE